MNTTAVRQKAFLEIVDKLNLDNTKITYDNVEMDIKDVMVDITDRELESVEISIVAALPYVSENLIYDGEKYQVMAIYNIENGYWEVLMKFTEDTEFTHSIGIGVLNRSYTSEFGIHYEPDIICEPDSFICRIYQYGGEDRSGLLKVQVNAITEKKGFVVVNRSLGRRLFLNPVLNASQISLFTSLFIHKRSFKIRSGVNWVQWFGTSYPISKVFNELSRSNNLNITIPDILDDVFDNKKLTSAIINKKAYWTFVLNPVNS